MNDPFCCSTARQGVLMVFSGWETPSKLFISVRGSGPPSNKWFFAPPPTHRRVYTLHNKPAHSRFCRFCTAHGGVQHTEVVIDGRFWTTAILNLSVCLRACLSNHVSKLHQIFYTCCRAAFKGAECLGPRLPTNRGLPPNPSYFISG